MRCAPALVLALAASATAATPPAPVDWSGRYVAEETAGPGMVMSYRIDVSRGAEGSWRAFVAADGHMTMRRLVTRGEEEGRRALVLRFVRGRPDDMGQNHLSYAAGDPVLTLELKAKGGRALRFPGRPLKNFVFQTVPPLAAIAAVAALVEKSRFATFSTDC